MATASRGWPALGFAGVLMAGTLTIAGPLNPPPGAVAPTMKTLDQVEPRIPLSAETTPGDANSMFRITAPGSYYLTGNVTVSGGSGIEIAASNVTIDLKGFTLQGGPLSQSGIRSEGSFINLVVKNGIVTGWGGHGVDLLGPSNGPEDPSLVSSVVATGNGGDGIRTLSVTLVRNCTTTDNGGNGITAGNGSIITNCTSNFNTGSGVSANATCMIRDCLVSFNSGDGISASEGSIFTDNMLRANGLGIRATDDCLIRGNNVDSCATGILVTGGDCRVDGNQVSDCTTGIDVDGTGNLIVRNSVAAGTTRYSLVASNRVGPIVIPPNSPAISGSTGGAGVGSTDPWANFSY